MLTFINDNANYMFVTGKFLVFVFGRQKISFRDVLNNITPRAHCTTNYTDLGRNTGRSVKVSRLEANDLI